MWLDYPDYKDRYPDSDLSESVYSALSDEAQLRIRAATSWRCDSAETPEELAALADAQAQLVLRLSAAGAVGSRITASGLTSVSNHGYSESYSAAQAAAQLDTECNSVILAALAGPATRWMIYRGGVYHPPRRR